jgi:glucose-1-phosphate thymidylyltransferase
MKGTVLAWGLGSRMYPLAKVTNKHLLPIYDEPRVYYPIETLVGARIREILVVTGGKNVGRCRHFRFPVESVESRCPQSSGGFCP